MWGRQWQAYPASRAQISLFNQRYTQQCSQRHPPPDPTPCKKSPQLTKHPTICNSPVSPAESSSPHSRPHPPPSPHFLCLEKGFSPFLSLGENPWKLRKSAGVTTKSWAIPYILQRLSPRGDIKNEMKFYKSRNYMSVSVHVCWIRMGRELNRSWHFCCSWINTLNITCFYLIRLSYNIHKGYNG